ncbi:uncharacterized protein LOC124660278 [Lolium rigidum]|uniref:uncharacterized protein LOC124660278 n=1 Tax=Lolium rigidum TaxID=89674 RepID=UPI001F5D17A6|nr:uncharacterized protein LOC124660278 [Lolium rigidum]
MMLPECKRIPSCTAFTGYASPPMVSSMPGHGCWMVAPASTPDFYSWASSRHCSIVLQCRDPVVPDRHDAPQKSHLFPHVLMCSTLDNSQNMQVLNYMKKTKLLFPFVILCLARRTAEGRGGAQAGGGRCIRKRCGEVLRFLLWIDYEVNGTFQAQEHAGSTLFTISSHVKEHGSLRWACCMVLLCTSLLLESGGKALWLLPRIHYRVYRVVSSCKSLRPLYCQQPEYACAQLDEEIYSCCCHP